ncbi:uncharacterized protein LOC117807007 isoform X1 [Notolabrus celidotus]|uniref:uncharacterized protein LOC117807007 isoform X1 n=1 Tax=Notolabrus celidotus TaxID=1203425 RepID=UPI00148FE335|nr:uncharacterized protein LOC117807007 isoform X1 [Notolabrus celidotus]XP_034531923.1 uncharacterized protein LOC117807007 isoform X1 [Notolabrus celidotus]
MMERCSPPTSPHLFSTSPRCFRKHPRALVLQRSHMSVNSSSFSNASHISNRRSFLCFDSPDGTFAFLTFATANFLLLLPLSILVIHVGFQRWTLQRSTSSTRVTSHTDVFTYHMVAMEFFTLLGSGLYCVADFLRNEQIMIAGFYLFSIILPGQTNFHCMTCIERYVAVVHPITYLGLRKTSGVRIRNISIGCVWLLSVGWMHVTYIHLPYLAVIPLFLFYTVSLLVISFCSLSVLWALRHPSPGDRSGDRVRVDQSKQRAFHTIMAIMGVLLLKFSGHLICLVIYRSTVAVGRDPCFVLKSSFWLSLPSSLVLPLLFLQRAGKLTCCKNNTASGQGSK